LVSKKPEVKTVHIIPLKNLYIIRYAKKYLVGDKEKAVKRIGI